MKSLSLPITMLENIDVLWTFMLLVVRFTGMFSVIPGIGMGAQGLPVRLAGIMVLSFASLYSSPRAALPDDIALMLASFGMEYSLGLLIGLVPLMMISGVQMAAQLASNTMGLGAAQMIDPASGGSVSSLSRLLGDTSIILFLLIGGHRVAVYVVSGMGGQLIPGSYLMTLHSVDHLIALSADIFNAGVMLSAPVIVALLLTQFVMGLISRAVPTVNIFIVSFPLTIGIGLVLSILSLPEMMVIIRQKSQVVERSMAVFVQDAKLLEANDEDDPSLD